MNPIFMAKNFALWISIYQKGNMYCLGECKIDKRKQFAIFISSKNDHYLRKYFYH